MKKLLSVVCLVFLLNTVMAQQLPANFHLTKLKNGLEVLVIEDRTVPLITIEVCVKNGAYTEDPEYNGLSHLYEHMFFKANKDLPSQEAFLNRVNELGIVFNGTTSDERVNYFFTLNKKFLEEGLSFMNSAIRFPLFDEKEMKNENPVVDGEFQRNESNPGFWLFQDMQKKLWGDLYSRKNAIGNHDIILTATTQKMQTIQKKYYYPNNSILVIAGDVNHDEAVKKAAALFESWQPSDFDPFVKYPIPEFKPLQGTTVFITENANTRNPFLMMAWHGPDTRHDLKATYAADVFSYILKQQSSKLQQELVDSGLAFNVNVGYQTCKYTGPITVFAVPHPDKIKEVIEKLEEHANQWDSDSYFTDEQLATAKNLLAIDDAHSREKTSDFIHTVTYWWASATIDYYTSYVDNLKKVTREDIKRYVQTYIKGKPKVIGVLSTPQNKPALEANLKTLKK
ncbi:M16 family metallopeptidase [Ohtaekwangia koreensis]|uniref:Predicted Zn-dependent peptidase n=1 Tax=Ohtaekwangia koreensis TaxID=688867 RepID=A0A1T5MMH6_9BACT|nr:pitrilysin family protein [Ohtaekwangia koreensis]SKC89204.1 Predicted Zn-dependent peptidase [Ohtaekwangia koreensis]